MSVSVRVQVAVHIEVRPIPVHKELDEVCVRVAYVGTKHQFVWRAACESLLVQAILEKLNVKPTTKDRTVLFVRVLDNQGTILIIFRPATVKT